MPSNSNHGFIPVSLTLRTTADTYGNNDATKYINTTKKSFSVILDIITVRQIVTIRFMIMKDQYSARVDRPLNSNDFFQQFLK